MTPNRQDAFAAELRWYWADVAGDMGLKSNFGAILAHNEFGAWPSTSHSTEVDERRLEAAAREKRIRRALAQLPGREHAILAHAFAPDSRELPAFGRATGVVPICPAARRAWTSSRTTRSFDAWLVRLVIRVHMGKGSGPEHVARDRALLQAIRTEAERMLRGALQAYAAACRYPGTRGGRAFERAAGGSRVGSERGRAA